MITFTQCCNPLSSRILGACVQELVLAENHPTEQIWAYVHTCTQQCNILQSLSGLEELTLTNTLKLDTRAYDKLY